jgi:subtilisin family serine protease
LLQFRNDAAALHELGCRVTSVAGDVAAASVPFESLDALKQHPEVVFVEASRPLKDETDISAVAINLVDPDTLLRAIPGKGRGALIGIIDSGFDLTHPCFSNSEGTKTRVLAAWDQARSNIVGSPPAGFDYGVEYTQDIINEHLAANKILVVRNQDGAGAHGTYVAGIAAGNGYPHGIYRGMAPEADLILVTYRNDVPVGGSAFVLDAIHYIREHARACCHPAVINISQGDNLGAHDGTSLLERAIDKVVEQGRVLVVTSAGNERGGPASHHAHGKVEQGSDFILPFALTPDARHPVDGDTIELWYRRGDRFAAALKTPGGWTSTFVSPGNSEVIKFPAGNQAHVYSEIDHPTNGDNHVGIILEKGEGWEAGTWELVLRGEEAGGGEFDAWADRHNGVTLIGFKAHQSDTSTITLPGNARRAITVGGFISRPEESGETGEVRGNVEPLSSIGPTRDGRVKPDLLAPGSLIMAPRMRTDSSPVSYDAKAGTSMAAPHVSGVIALLWALRPQMTAGQIRAALLPAAAKDTLAGSPPGASSAHGKLDAGAAHKALLTLLEKGETKMAKERVFEFELDPRPKKNGEMAGMRVRIEVNGGESATITGTSQGESYVGHLIMRKKPVGEGKGKSSGIEELAGTEGLDKADGGDECYVTTPPPPHWENPCPTGSE